MEKNLHHQEALKKFKTLVEDISICMFVTNIGGEEHTRPMATIDVDDDANLWFFTSKSTSKVKDLNATHDVHLLYSHPGKDSYLSLKGAADLVEDPILKEAKWKKIVEAYFPDGKNDPDICLLRVIPNEAHYWDTATNKFIEGIKIVASIFTGRKLSDAEEGELELK